MSPTPKAGRDDPPQPRCPRVTPRRLGDPAPDLATYHLAHDAIQKSMHEIVAVATAERDGAERFTSDH